MTLVNEFQKEFWFRVLEDLSQDLCFLQSWSYTNANDVNNGFKKCLTLFDMQTHEPSSTCFSTLMLWTSSLLLLTQSESMITMVWNYDIGQKKTMHTLCLQLAHEARDMGPKSGVICESQHTSHMIYVLRYDSVSHHNLHPSPLVSSLFNHDIDHLEPETMGIRHLTLTGLTSLKLSLPFP